MRSEVLLSLFMFIGNWKRRTDQERRRRVKNGAINRISKRSLRKRRRRRQQIARVVKKGRTLSIRRIGNSNLGWKEERICKERGPRISKGRS